MSAWFGARATITSRACGPNSLVGQDTACEVIGVSARRSYLFSVLSLRSQSWEVPD